MKQNEIIIENVQPTTNNGEIILYQPDSSIRLEVRMEEETVWLTQAQMAMLFETSRNNITLHIKNIFKEGELEERAVCKDFLLTAADGKKYKTKLYNLDVIISVGYRVKSKWGTRFRIWANKVLKEYLLRGYAINQHIQSIERRIDRQLQEHSERIHDLEDKVGLFVRTALPPVEGIFFDGQIFDAYAFVSDLIRSAKKRIILIDNYIDDSVLLMLAKRVAGVTASDSLRQRQALPAALVSLFHPMHGSPFRRRRQEPAEPPPRKGWRVRRPALFSLSGKSYPMYYVDSKMCNPLTGLYAAIVTLVGYRYGSPNGLGGV